LTLQGKGFYIWQIPRCENGDVDAIANLASVSAFSHVLVKIADGTSPYNIYNDVDAVPPLVAALKDRSIQVLGWHYCYGYEPLAEAAIAIQRITQLGLDGYVIDAEAPFKEPGKDESARQFMDSLRATLPDFPIGLSSYRYPTYHPAFPWQAFLEKCDFNMPQMYWLQAHDPAEQLIRCVREFQAIIPFRPIFPTGAAFKEGGWQPTVSEVIEFLSTAQNLNLSAANFWEWYNCRTYLPEIWDTIKIYPWPTDVAEQDIVQRYFAALNAHDPAGVLALYHPKAVHVTASRTVQGPNAIGAWYIAFFNQLLPNATFNLLESTGTLASRQFTWTAASSAGTVDNGRDALGLVEGKILYHYTYFTIT
jgi:hypothetical protein